jgi:hypothetical protein
MRPIEIRRANERAGWFAYCRTCAVYTSLRAPGHHEALAGALSHLRTYEHFSRLTQSQAAAISSRLGRDRVLREVTKVLGGNWLRSRTGGS